MSGNVAVTVERRLDHPRARVFRAWVEPSELARWRGSPGWHVEAETLHGDPQPGGRHHHVKVRDSDPTTRVGTDGVYTEFFEPHGFVSRERVTGDPGIDPDVPLELRVELTPLVGDATLVRVVQGPYEPDVASWHAEGWERELARLEAFLDASAPPAP